MAVRPPSHRKIEEGPGQFETGGRHVATDESRLLMLRRASSATALVGGAFGLLGVVLLFWYVWEAFGDMPARIGWWAAISIVLCVIFLLGYAVASDLADTENAEIVAASYY